ncbi:MAG: FtsX-like permease family protein, partial [Bryobacteraceae bacterium]
TIIACIPAEAGPQQLNILPDWRILIYTLSLSVLAGILFGLIPALNVLRSNLTPALKSDGLDSASGRRRIRLQDALVALQVAACLVLLVSAGLLLRGFRSAVHMDFGRSVKNVLLASVDLRQEQYQPEQALHFWETARQTAATFPGVRGASITENNPFLGECLTAARIISGSGKLGQPVQTTCESVGTDYFSTMNISLLRGRDFRAADLKGDGKVVIVDQHLVERYFGGGDPIGRRIRIGEKPEDDREVIGVVAATRTLNDEYNQFPRVYHPLSRETALRGVLLVAYSGPRLPLARAIQKVMGTLDPNVNVTIRPIEDNFNIALLAQKIAVGAASALGGLGLLLACTGVYGVVAFAVGRRRREVGIRMALGAAQKQVLSLLLWQGLKPVLAGAVLGLLLSAAASQLIRSMLYGISPVDPLAFLSTSAILTLMAAAAAVIPARSALRVDPARTLRHD